MGTLKTGFLIGDNAYTEFELREVTTADLLDAEDYAPVVNTLQYAAEVMRRQLVRVTTADGSREFRGPFTVAMIRKLKPADFWALRKAQRELDEAGESESASDADSSNPSS
jgi:phage FluMu protein gp41